MRTIHGKELFEVPRGIAITPRGRLLVVERTRVALLTLTGRLIDHITVPGAANMLDVAVDGPRAFVTDVVANAIFVLSLPEGEGIATEHAHDRASAGNVAGRDEL